MAIDLDKYKIDLEDYRLGEPSEPTKNLGGFIGNVVTSGTEAIGNIVGAVSHPIQTIKSLGKVGAGAIQSIPGISNFYDKASTERGREILESNRQAFGNVVSYFGNRYGGKNPDEIIKNIGNTAYNDPVGFVLDLSTLLETGGFALTKAGQVSKIPQLQKAGEITTSISPMRISGTLKKGQTEEEIAGKITQAKPRQIPSVTRTLTSVDLSGVKTFDDLSGVLNKNIKSNLLKVDEKLATSKQIYNIDKANTANNPVLQSISDLKELYQKTREPEELKRVIEIENRLKKSGLSAKEINDLARNYGTEFGNKAFGKTGEPLTSVNAKAYENTRKALKETSRSLMPDEITRTLDKSVTDAIRTKELSDKLATKAKLLENKLRKTGLLYKTGIATAHLFDMGSLGIIRGAVRGLNIGIPQSKYFDVLELQSKLVNNINLLDKLNSAKTAGELETLIRASFYAGNVNYNKSE